MSKAGFWKKDWFLGLGVTLVLLFAGGSQLIQSLERSAYDWGVRASSRAPSDKVAVIAIDDQSLSNIGRWPWSREVMAKMTDKLAAAKAKLIANTVLFFEPQLDAGLVYVNKLQEIYGRLVPAGTDPNKPPRGLSSELAQIGTMLREAESALNPDRKLAESFEKAGNVLLPIDVAWGEPRGKPDRPLPEFVVKNALQKVSTGEDLPLLTRALQYPIENLGKEAVGLGHLNLWKDIDGTVRSEPLVVAYFDHYFPSLSMMIAAKSLNLGVGDIAVQLGEGVRLGKLKITTDSALLMNTYFYKDRDGRPAFQVDSFYDLYSGKIPVDKYRDKIVLIGFTASGQTELPATPISPAMPPVLTLAHAVSSILQEHFFVRPTWGIWVEFLVFVLIAAYLIVLLPRLSAGVGAGATIGVAALVLAAHARMLGLAFRGEGQLDRAFDYFRKVPLDETVMDNLYNLALDFERKRQFNKAEAAFRYMADYNPKFRDLEARLSRAKQMSETVLLGGAQTHPGGTLVLGGGAEKPMLGRYQVEKEIGKGAMGAVYLGKDPKIGRVVAVKTMALSQEFEADELQDVKERFFREAETAGRLSHTNIVTIFDAGEEHDLCYIAMELLKGKDLVPFTKPGNTLPIEKVISIVARVADALGYAHRQNVVHRDVKPANVMYEAEN